MESNFSAVHKWGCALQSTAVSAVAGGAAAALVAVVLFRNPTTRAVVIGIGVGFGAGRESHAVKRAVDSGAVPTPPALRSAIDFVGSRVSVPEAWSATVRDRMGLGKGKDGGEAAN